MSAATDKPWDSPWWAALVACAVRGGSNAAEIVRKVNTGCAVGWPVDGGYLVLERTPDSRVCIWLGVGRGVRNWCGAAEREVSAFARSLGCTALVIEGRRGWRRILPHWTVKGDDLELELDR